MNPSFHLVTFLLLSVLAISARSLQDDDDGAIRQMHEKWARAHGKQYNGSTEKEKRFKIFKANLQHINNRNAEKKSFKLGLNKFADLTNEEFRTFFVGKLNVDFTHNQSSLNLANAAALTDLPTSVDWRKQGAVSESGCRKLLGLLSDRSRGGTKLPGHFNAGFSVRAAACGL